MTGVASGPGTVSGGDTVPCGDDVTLTATPTSVNDEVKSWSGGGCSGTGTSCTVMTSGATPSVTVTVTFGARPTWELRTSVSVCCGSIGVSPAGPYYRDSNPPVKVTLTARPRGLVFSFDSWGGDCAGETSATCELTMSDDRDVTVSFSHSCDGNTGIGCGRQEDEDGGNGGQPPPPP
ncbi:MAG: hypothetical protein F4X25_01990 [Chloroflexi bacterium]|nr:hypothetical protein [Chloroflexota bacterium]